MKRVFLCMAMLMISIAISSQNRVAYALKADPYPMLRGVEVFNYRIDFSKLKIEGMDAKDYIIGFVYDEDDNKDVAFNRFSNKVENKFIAYVNRELKGKYKLDNSSDSRFEIVVSFLIADEDGGHKMTGEIIDKENKQTIAEIKSSAGGGRLNKFDALFIEELEKSTEKFCDRLRDNVLSIANHKRYKK